MKQRATRLVDKFNQVLITPSGRAIHATIKHVFLRVDGTLSGRVEQGVMSGAKVSSNSLSTGIWEVEL